MDKACIGQQSLPPVKAKINYCPFYGRVHLVSQNKLSIPLKIHKKMFHWLFGFDLSCHICFSIKIMRKQTDALTNVANHNPLV